MNMAGLQVVNYFLRGNRALASRLTCGRTKAACAAFSTSNKSDSLSSQDSFDLRHQMISEKKSNTKWTIYRMASVGVLGGVAGCFICPGNPIVDFVTVTLIVHHNYHGMNSVIADYAPLMFKDWFVKILGAAWLAICIATLGLLYAFNYNGIGFSKAVNNFFKL